MPDESIPSEGSPSPSLHSLEVWQHLLASLEDAPPDMLNALIGRYAWNVVWPLLPPEQRSARIQSLPSDDKRLLLALLFRRMIEHIRLGTA